MSKGIFQQIKDASRIEIKNNLKIKDLEDILNDLTEKERKRKEKNKIIEKENYDHLVKRSNELNKDIPLELLFMTNPTFNPGLYVSAEFVKKYKEWLN